MGDHPSFKTTVMMSPDRVQIKPRTPRPPVVQTQHILMNLRLHPQPHPSHFKSFNLVSISTQTFLQAMPGKNTF